jgi:hypothetical protein
MNDCTAAVSHLQELGESTVADFDRRVASLPADLCAPFNQEAARLESELLMIYKMVALCARAESDLDKVAAGWARTVEICDVFASRLLTLSKVHPDCGAESFHDRVLDLRNKCRRLQQLHS